MQHVHIAIIGAGPAALAVAVHLALADPAVVAPAQLAVVDPSGDWLTVWSRQMERQRIRQLRSPVVHHPHPSPFEMLGHLDEATELTRPDGLHLPRSDAFERFCRGLVEVHGLSDVVLSGLAAGAVMTEGGAQVRLDDGHLLQAQRLVVATNPRRPVVPTWARRLPQSRVFPGGRLGAGIAERRIVVVGGGLSAAQLALGAVEDGAHVTLLSRRPIVTRRMDVDPTWLGPSKMEPFRRMPADRRRMALDEARGGGTMPNWALRALRNAERKASLRLCEGDPVTDAAVEDHGLVLASVAGRRHGADEVWLATGSAVDVTRDPVLRDVLAAHPVEIHQGYPMLTEELRWGAAPVWVAGAAAGLQVGPVAGNLYGQREAARRICAAVLGGPAPGWCA